MNKFALLAFIFGFIFASSVISVTDILLEDQEESYRIEGTKYEVKVLSIEQNQVDFSVGVNITPILNKDDTYELKYIMLTIHNITYVDDTSGLNSVNFSLDFNHNKCGNDICDGSETCSSCVEDCACGLNYQCTANKCVEELRCGDHRCSAGETCIIDQCCDGWNYHLEYDKSNCGTCGNVCTADEECISGYCTNSTGYCGDNNCDSNENCGTCIRDCACDSGYGCIDNSCVSLNECLLDSDCGINETCVDNKCEVSLQETSNLIESVGAGFIDPDEIPTDDAQTEELQSVSDSKEGKSNLSKLFLFLILIIPSSIFLFLFYRKNQKTADSKYQKPYKSNYQAMQQNPDDIRLRNYIQQGLSKGHNPEALKKMLLKSNWPEQKINDAFSRVR